MNPTSIASEVDPPVPFPDVPPDLSDAADDPRSRIGGRYAVDLATPLGGGGMALVYRGQDLRTRRDVAVKTLRPQYRYDAETRARFRREARVMAFLAHPNVARVYDFVEDQGTSWVVLEFVAGRSVKELLAERGPFSVGETADVLDQVAAALAHLHGRGLVHLDVKPQNLLMTPEGRVKLIDFGLAQEAGGAQEVINGTTFGTAAYLAPEQACGEPVAVATDVYALGCVVYELLTGRPPFDDGAAGGIKNDVIRAHLERLPVAPTAARPDLALPGWVDDVVLWSLAKDPAARYGDAPAFARLFRAGEQGEGMGAGLGTTAPLSLVGAPLPVTYAPVADVLYEPARRWRPLVALYRLGGRAARRTGGLRATLWRIVGALGLGNAMLAAVLFMSQGRVPGLYEPVPALGIGDRARVTVDGLRVRDTPDMAGIALTTVDAGERVTLTGAAIGADGDEWWPVVIDEGGDEVAGYVSATGLSGGDRRTPLERLRDAVGI